MDATSPTAGTSCWRCAAVRTGHCRAADHGPCEHCQSFETWNDWAAREASAIAQTQTAIYVAIAMIMATLALAVLPAL